MPLSTGTRLGPYEITAQIGEGGMGEVYRATDTTLKRQVAIKILPMAVVDDADRLARFQREAEVLASLNHPHIAQIYGLQEGPAARPEGRERAGEAGPHVRALVMELVEGPTLADRIAQGALPLDEALPIARQIAEALEAAHEQGIIHRDLKPANIKVREDGTVKVLDFGLAKLASQEDVGRVARSGPAGAGLSQSPTITSPAMMTGAGMILGTAAYMSPEQARGKPVDKRADIWAFGCVLFEMLTGRRAFAGDDIADVMVAVLSKEPEWAALPAATPAGVRSALRRCLERERTRRLRDIGDAGILIDEVAIPQAAGAPALARGSRRLTYLTWSLAGAVLASLVALAVAYRPQPASDLRSVRFSVQPPEGISLLIATGQSSYVLSPDGRHLVFAGIREGNVSLWLRDLDSLEARPLPGAENATYPFWSPDSRTIGFFADGSLKTIDASGGPIRTLCATPGGGRGAAWSREGVIVFSSAQLQGLFSVPAAGGQPVQVTAAEGVAQGSYRLPSFLPDGRRFVFTAFPGNEIRLGSLDSTDSAKVLDAESQAQFVPQGYLLFVRQGTLLAQPFDAGSATPTGDAVPLVEQVFVDGNSYALFSAADSGTLAFRSGGAAEETQLTWFDRSGAAVGAPGPPGRYRNPVLSPDRTRVAVEVVSDADRNRDIWLLELARGVMSRFTFDPRNDVNPVWAPDGSRIVFGSDREGGVFSLYQKPSSGAATEELFFTSTVENAVPYSWSPDGRFILHRYMNGGAFNTGVLPLEGDRKARLFLPVPFNQTMAQISPDGRWIAYHSNESGRFEVFVQTFPTPAGKWQVSKDGGYYPMWRGDGREIFYYAANGQLTAVPVTTGAALEVGSAVPLFRADMLNGPSTAVGFRAQYDVTPDGQRFLLNVPVAEAQRPSITVVLNWAAPLRQP